MRNWEDIPSIHELRRRAPGHYWSRASNARYTAYVLAHIDELDRQRFAQAIDYGGATGIAADEAFRREAAIALELIIKAVIAQRIENGSARPDVTRVRPVHDLPTLWGDAGLPALSREDQHRLHIAKRILYWSGRYAAPNKDEKFDKEEAAMEHLKDTRPLGTLKLTYMRSFDWEDVDRLYRTAANSLSDLMTERF